MALLREVFGDERAEAIAAAVIPEEPVAPETPERSGTGEDPGRSHEPGTDDKPQGSLGL